MPILKAGVIGAGTMGAEITQVVSYSGLPVVLKDVDLTLLERGLARIHDTYQRQVDKGKMSSSEMGTKLALIEPALSHDRLRDADIIIEAVPERMELKKRIFAELDAVCPETTLFASNTSALSISEMGAATKRPTKMIGMHFFNPAHVMKLVEVIPGLDTAQETVDAVVSFAESLHKIPVVVQECPGFLVNRLLMPYLNEATLCLQEGAASADTIDSALTDFGMPMGPFTLIDMLGIDVCGDIEQYLYREYGERMAPAELFGMLIAANRLGEKVSAGFYGYGGESDAPVQAMIAAIQRRGSVRAASPFSVERLVYPLINEAALCLQECIAGIPDIDMAMVAGTGMTWHGERMGPLALADHLGLDAVLAGLDKFQRAAWGGERFRPARLLKLKVRAGHVGRKVGKGFHEYMA